MNNRAPLHAINTNQRHCSFWKFSSICILSVWSHNYKRGFEPESLRSVGGVKQNHLQEKMKKKKISRATSLTGLSRVNPSVDEAFTDLTLQTDNLIFGPDILRISGVSPWLVHLDLALVT